MKGPTGTILIQLLTEPAGTVLVFFTYKMKEDHLELLRVSGCYRRKFTNTANVAIYTTPASGGWDFDMWRYMKQSYCRLHGAVSLLRGWWGNIKSSCWFLVTHSWCKYLKCWWGNNICNVCKKVWKEKVFHSVSLLRDLKQWAIAETCSQRIY